MLTAVQDLVFSKKARHTHIYVPGDAVSSSSTDMVVKSTAKSIVYLARNHQNLVSTAGKTEPDLW